MSDVRIEERIDLLQIDSTKYELAFIMLVSIIQNTLT